LPAERRRANALPFLGFLYLSVVAPLSGRGYPPGSTTFLEMTMRHSGQYDSTALAKIYEIFYSSFLFTAYTA